MSDTLRSIADGMEHRTVSDCSIPQWGELVARGLTHFDHDENCCPKCRLEALLAEYEKVDLVKRWRFHEDGVCEHVRLTGCDDKRSCHEVDADVLETWLAVNLERIKAQARLEEAKWWLGPTEPHEFPNHSSRKCVQCQRIAALEAQAKEKP